MRSRGRLHRDADGFAAGGRRACLCRGMRVFVAVAVAVAVIVVVTMVMWALSVRMT